MAVPRVTRTESHVVASAPCGHEVPVPNAAYGAKPVPTEPCPECGTRWQVKVETIGYDTHAMFLPAERGSPGGPGTDPLA
jgi:hypothetical protein